MDDFLIKNNKNIQVLTDTGWSDFLGIADRGYKPTVEIFLNNGKQLQSTLDHKIYLTNGQVVEAATLRVGSQVQAKSGPAVVVTVKLTDEEFVYDLISVEKNRRYYANDVLVSNCEFIIADETLIQSTILAEMEGIEPIERLGQVRWYQPIKKGKIYTVALDPSLGTGGDPAAIQVFEAGSTSQVAEWKHNKTPIPQQIKVFVEIIKHIHSITNEQLNIYYSVENNTIGEAALISLSDYGEENIPGIFLSEPKRAGSGRRFRKGFLTTPSSKLSACSKLKTLVENKKMKIYSKSLISELKNFVSTGQSYAA